MAKRILVPLSGRERAEAVLPLVAHAARNAGSTLRPFYVAPYPQMRTGPDSRVIAYVDQETDRLEAESQEYLREVEGRLDGVAVELRVRFGDPAHEIALEAEAFGADLIAMVTPKPRWLGPRLLGKVARRVLRRATAPVMLLRA
jgi:nucleotide-binding universal stress UspA family protein